MKYAKLSGVVSAMTLAGLIALPTAQARPDKNGRGPGMQMMHEHGGPGCPEGECRGKHHGKRGGGGKRGVIGDLIDPCGAACRAQAKACRTAAIEQVKTCARSTCPSQIEAAQTACPAGERPRHNEACRSAVDAVVACANTCFDSEKAGFEACKDAADTCREGCRAQSAE